MKRNIVKLTSFKMLMGICLGFTLASCNKDLPDPIPNTFPVATTSIGEYMQTDTNFRLYRLAATKTGIFPLLLDRTKSYTVYAPSNTAFRNIGFDSIQIINASGATLTSLAGIVYYHMIPGEQWKSTLIPTTFPNVQLPTSVPTGNFLPTTVVPFPLTAFLSRRGSDFWYNTSPGLPTTVDFTYGSLNQISRVAIPPQTMVNTSTAPGNVAILGDANLALFDSLILRAGSDQAVTNPSRFDSIMKNGGANLTVFAVTNAGMKAFNAFISGGAVPAPAPDAIHAAFIRTSFPLDLAKAVIASHILATPVSATAYLPHRAFSVNFSTTPTFYKTLLNTNIAAHPGVNVTAFFTGQSVDSLKAQGAGALTPGGAGPMATAKPANTFDRNAINGVVHVIDHVLRP